MISNELNLEALNNLSEEEKKLALQILEQIADTGSSELLDDLKYSAFEEIPVDINTFLDDDRYLGKGIWTVDEQTGERKCTLFPYWRETLKKIFPDNITTAYNTLILTGAIGLGKTLVGTIAMCYLMYRMLCLKDPYSYYGMMPSDKITFSMLNITLDTAQGVGWDKIQQLTQGSDWFMEHGNMNASRTNPQWQPPKGIELIFGSNNRHVVGRALFCLDGDTEIATTDGIFKIKDLVNKQIKVFSVKSDGSIVTSDFCTVKPTVKTKVEYQITLEDNSIIKCTPEHRFLLTSGEYKQAKDLTESDEIAEAYPQAYFDFINDIIKKRGQWDPKLKDNYCERHHIIPKCLGGEPKNLNWTHHNNVIWLTAAEHFIAHKLLALEHPTNDKLVSAYKRMCYTKDNKYLATAKDYELVRKLWGKAHSLALSGRKLSLELIKKRKQQYSTERKQKLSIRFSGEGNNMYGKGFKIASEKNGCYSHPIEPERLVKIKQARSKFIYSYLDKTFFGWIELRRYLNTLGYNISQAGIESCVLKKPGTKAKYPALWGQIYKRPKEAGK